MYVYCMCECVCECVSARVRVCVWVCLCVTVCILIKSVKMQKCASWTSTLEDVHDDADILSHTKNNRREQNRRLTEERNEERQKYVVGM